MAESDDFLSELIEERTRTDPEFPSLVEAALLRRVLLRRLAARREELGLSQTAVAARMGTSQSAVARLEAGAADVRLSTVERYAAAMGHRVEWRLVCDSPAKTTAKGPMLGGSGDVKRTGAGKARSVKGASKGAGRSVKGSAVGASRSMKGTAVGASRSVKEARSGVSRATAGDDRALSRP